MNKISLALMICLPACAGATSLTGQKASDVDVIVSSAAKQGATQIIKRCDENGVCSITWNEPDGKSVQFTDPKIAKTALLDQLLAIKTKILLGTATQDDLAQGFLLAMQLMGL